MSNDTTASTSSHQYHQHYIKTPIMPTAHMALSMSKLGDWSEPCANAIDYLSEEIWNSLDILETRKFLVRATLSTVPAILSESEPHLIKAKRYTNALWRRWHMSQYHSGRLAPAEIGWLKDADSQFLYGTFHQHPLNVPVHLKMSHSGSITALHRHISQPPVGQSPSDAIIDHTSSSVTSKTNISKPEEIAATTDNAVIDTAKRRKSASLPNSPSMSAAIPPKGILKRPSELNLLDALLIPLAPSMLEKLDAIKVDSGLASNPKHLIGTATYSPPSSDSSHQSNIDSKSPDPIHNAISTKNRFPSRPLIYKRHSTDYSPYAFYEGSSMIQPGIATFQSQLLLPNKQKSPNSSSSTVSFASMLENTVIIKNNDDEYHDDADEDDASSIGSFSIEAVDNVESVGAIDTHKVITVSLKDNKVPARKTDLKRVGNYYGIQHIDFEGKKSFNIAPVIAASSLGRQYVNIINEGTDNIRGINADGSNNNVANGAQLHYFVRMLRDAYLNGVEVLFDAFIVVRNAIIFGGLL